MKVETGLVHELKNLYLALQVIPQLIESKNHIEPIPIPLKLIQDNRKVKNQEITIEQLFQKTADPSTEPNQTEGVK